MAAGMAVRIGGICGILFVVLVVPSFLSPPDTPVAASGPQDVIDYFNSRQDGILIFNGCCSSSPPSSSCGSSGCCKMCYEAPRARGTASRPSR